MNCGPLLWVILSTIIQTRSHKVAVQVQQGILVGTREKTVFERKYHYAFYGVPYAEPPVGNLRFKNPVPVKKWKKYFDARAEYRGACAQAHVIHKHALYGAEDCLYMNIFTPSLPKDGKTTLKPIIVWVHGYAFTTSFSHLQGGDFFVDNDVIFVSVSQRLSVFGFLKRNITDSNANMGLKDIVMALKWIRKNAKQFNGDKDKITVMGSDSAATFLSLLLMTKSNKLFSKMILQSGGLFSPSIFQTNAESENAKISRSIKNRFKKTLINASTKDIINASLTIYKNKDWIDFQKPVMPFSPIVESYMNKSLITMNYQEKKFKTIKLNIPVMIGFNSQESISEVMPFIHNPHYLNSFKTLFKYMVPFTGSCNYSKTSPIYNEISNKIKNQYFKSGISSKSLQDFILYSSDLSKYPIYKFIKEFLRHQHNKLYVYKFDYVGKLNAVKATSIPGVDFVVKGAAKGDEICYLMKCEPLWETYVTLYNDTNDPDRKFIKEISEIWSNFAKSGNPTPRLYFGNVTWLPMTQENDHILLLGKRSRLINAKIEEKMFSFWNGIYDEYYARERCSKHKHDEL